MATTTTDKMLARADEYDRLAKALRLAAAEMNGHAAERAHARLPQLIEGAAKLRQQQRDPQAGQYADNRPSELLDDEKITGILKFYIAAGIVKTSELRARLQAEHGIDYSGDQVRRRLNDDPDVTIKGTGSGSRWRLRGKRAAPSAAEGSELTNGHKALWLATTLRDKGPMTTKELSAAAREAGIGGLTGIIGYVRKGYLTKTGRARGKMKYSFRAMPPTGGEAPPA